MASPGLRAGPRARTRRPDSLLLTRRPKQSRGGKARAGPRAREGGRGRPAPLLTPRARGPGRLGPGASRPHAGSTWAPGSQARGGRRTRGTTPYRGGPKESSRERRRAAMQPGRASWRPGLVRARVGFSGPEGMGATLQDHRSRRDQPARVQLVSSGRELERGRLRPRAAGEQEEDAELRRPGAGARGVLGAVGFAETTWSVVHMAPERWGKGRRGALGEGRGSLISGSPGLGEP